MKQAQLRRRKQLAVAIVAAGAAQLNSGWVSAAESMLQLEEIIVTAQKSDDRIQDIPSTVNVVSAEMLEDLQLNTFADLSQVTAGLSLDVLTGRRQSLNMRAVQTNPDAGFADGVAVYWNNVAVRPDVAFQQLFDVDRIEVLRGPQGTLQGQTSPAGAIQIHTRAPYLDKFSGTVQQTFSDNDGTNTEFGVSVPIIVDQLAVRVAGVYDSHDLDVSNISTGQDASSLSRAGRVSVVWAPTDSFTAKYVYEYLEKISDGAEVIAGPGNGTAARPRLTAGDRKAFSRVDNLNSNRNKLNSLELTWDLDIHQLTSVTGYYTSDQDVARDNDPGFRFSTALVPDTTTIIPVSVERWVEEVRLASDISDFWQSLVGVYYQQDDIDAKAIAFPQPGLFTGLAFFSQDTFVIPQESKTYAIFTHQKFQITENGLLEVGLRYQKVDQENKSTLTRRNYVTGAVVSVTEQIPAAREDEASAEAVTGSLKYSYTFSPDLMVYGSYDQSFRPGGMATSTTRLTEQFLLFEEEESQGIEVGFKSTWLDNRLRFNGDVFYQQIDNGLYRSNGVSVENNPLNATTDGTARIVYNADAVVKGAELDLEGVITENWRAGGNVSYVDAKYDGATVPCNNRNASNATQEVVLCDSDGRAGSEPNWSASANTTYTIPMGAVNGYFTLLAKYQSFRDDDLTPNSRIDSVTTANVYLGVRDANDMWDVNVWVKNVTGEDDEFIPAESLDGITYRLARPVEPRVVGLTAKYNFGG